MHDRIDLTGGQSEWKWPSWARTARIAGAYFHPSQTAAEIDGRLARLADEGVTVVIADSPWGQQYAAWVDDPASRQVQELMAVVVSRAHALGLKVVLYHTGLELLSDPQRNPGLEHPEWAQRSLSGQALLFNDVTTQEQHWLDEGIWDMWVSPCLGTPQSASYGRLLQSRVREIVATGIDGLWVDEVYLQSSVGSHHDLWPSTDPCSVAAFRSATGHEVPQEPDWDNADFRQWVVWRHDQIRDLLLAEKDAARAINPHIVFVNENSCIDTGRSTYVANDPAAYVADPDITTGHEIAPIAYRMDYGQTGMKQATLDDWLAFRTMVAFARAADRGKPSWILTYGCEPRDSAQLAGLVLAEGANFYETKGPQMADTVGAGYRADLFHWIARHEADIYDGESLAQIGLLYSPRTRDLVDGIAGEPYAHGGSVHFAAYRSVAVRLYRNHIPFDIVIDTDVAAFGRYDVLIAPEVQAMADGTAQALRDFAGRLVVVGKTGYYDEWLNRRSVPPLAAAARPHLAGVIPKVAALADTGLLETQAAPSVQLGLRSHPEGYSLVLVNTARKPARELRIGLRLRPGETVTAVRMAAFGAAPKEVSLDFLAANGRVEWRVPGGLDTLALLRLHTIVRQ